MFTLVTTIPFILFVGTFVVSVINRSMRSRVMNGRIPVPTISSNSTTMLVNVTYNNATADTGNFARKPQPIHFTCRRGDARACRNQGPNEPVLGAKLVKFPPGEVMRPTPIIDLVSTLYSTE